MFLTIEIYINNQLLNRLKCRCNFLLTRKRESLDDLKKLAMAIQDMISERKAVRNSAFTTSRQPATG